MESYLADLVTTAYFELDKGKEQAFEAIAYKILKVYSAMQHNEIMCQLKDLIQASNAQIYERVMKELQIVAVPIPGQPAEQELPLEQGQVEQPGIPQTPQIPNPHKDIQVDSEIQQPPPVIPPPIAAEAGPPVLIPGPQAPPIIPAMQPPPIAQNAGPPIQPVVNVPKIPEMPVFQDANEGPPQILVAPQAPVQQEPGPGAVQPPAPVQPTNLRKCNAGNHQVPEDELCFLTCPDKCKYCNDCAIDNYCEGFKCCPCCKCDYSDSDFDALKALQRMLRPGAEIKQVQKLSLYEEMKLEEEKKAAVPMETFVCTVCTNNLPVIEKTNYPCGSPCEYCFACALDNYLKGYTRCPVCLTHYSPNTYQEIQDLHQFSDRKNEQKAATPADNEPPPQPQQVAPPEVVAVAQEEAPPEDAPQ